MSVELKPGYKLTEVGVIPEDWKVHHLGGLLTGAPNYGINAPAISYDSRYPTYLRITDISEYGQFIDESKASVNHPLSGSYMLSEGDLVLARTGASVGKSYLYDHLDGELVFAGFLIRARPNPMKLEPKFLKYYTHSQPYWNWVKVNSMRSGQPGINGREFASLPLPLPPTKAEQEAIAEALSDADALIESLEQLISKKRHLKQGAMQELLTGKKRLPGFLVKSGNKQTEIGLIPEDWRITQLNEVASKITVGFVGSMAHLFRNEGIPLLRGQNVLPHKIDFSDTKYISIDTHKLWKKSSLRSGDVVMVRVGYPGTSSVIPNDFGEANAASLVIVSPSAEKLDSNFLCYMVNSEFGRCQIDSYLVGGAQQVLNTTTAAIFKLPLPTKAEQTAIAAILSDMDTEIAALETKLAKTRSLKQGMMHELLTGKTRLL
ncbi:MAG: restriction endonuclease subunit S [Methylophilaceae bacterium]